MRLFNLAVMNALTGVITMFATAVPTEITVSRPFSPISILELISTHDDIPTSSLQASSISASTNCSPRTTPEAIALSVIGTLASVIVFQIVFILVLAQKRSKYHDRARESVRSDIEPATIPESNSNLTSMSESFVSAEPLICGPTPLSPITERLSESSHHAYEEEIERLREEVLVQKTLNRIIHEQLELVHCVSPPPSYRSRRSNNSYYIRSSTSVFPFDRAHSIRV
ncbi:hypothetical protein IW261DRAFT_1487421 [Armillaria novae-zelandiae]|uniref:Uncharacterized protein n=1 Tax=Armillaria novae-zelandiae TaxID=153914 RepID=A0AA39P4E7_9AGAR|nr:hypothetical protein IW261DRAFT_1487421 [Armillaria novae-zelandiae]